MAAVESKQRLSIGILAGGGEASWLEDCLKRLQGCGLNIFVLASHEHPEITGACERHGVEYHYAPLPGGLSFAERRNLQLSLCKTPWLLNLDVDESIDEFSLAQAKELSQKPPHGAYMVRHPYLNRDGVMLVDHQPRLLPADPSWRFEGHISVTLRQEHQDPESILPCNLQIQDLGAVLDPGRMERRGERANGITRDEMKRIAALARQPAGAELGQVAFRYFIIGRFRAARHFWRLLIERGQDNTAVQFYLGRLEQRQGPEGAARAVERWQRLVELGAQYYSLYVYLGRQYAQMGDWAGARDIAGLGQRLHPYCAPILHLLSLAYFKCGDLIKAKSVLAQGKRHNPNFPLFDKLAMVLEYAES